MRSISTRTHGVPDYLMGVLLIVVPYILGFADGTAAQWFPQIVGAALIGASPRLFGFPDRGFRPHLIVGLLEIGAGLTTRSGPETAAVAEGAQHTAKRPW